MEKETKKIIAREWLIFVAIGLSFPISKFIMVNARAFQEIRAGVKLPDVTNVEAAMFLLLFYILYLSIKSTVWSIKTLREK